MHTAIVILNWNTKDYLRRFLPGLLASTADLDAEVVVADNASTDGSMEVMRKHFPDVRTIEFDLNHGFTGGYNRALAQLEADLYVLINSDIEVTPDWLGPLVQWMESHPDCGACAPKLHSFDERDKFEYAGAAGGLLDRWGYPFCRGRVLKRTERDEGQYDLPTRVLWASGACLMVRAETWKQCNGLDDRFFAHMEEIDLCWRMQLEGWSVWTVPQSTVYHLGGGTLPAGSPWKIQLNYRNSLLMLENCLPYTLSQQGYPALSAVRRTRRIIFWRMILDGASACVYLVTGKRSHFVAVLTAHGEYRRLRRIATEEELAVWAAEHPQGTQVAGLYPGSILWDAFRKGKRIFNYLRVYENHH